ncbi:hypothetical protein [Streptomyces sp. MNU89]|uniref:hypothetical protein n=1 Tax=Streptomyces sp. MNU89 TaxID=2560025 RepID=UPI0035A82BC7
MLRDHVAVFGTAEDGRIFASERGNLVASSSYYRVWRQARDLAFVPRQVSIDGQEQEMNDRIMCGLGEEE